MKHCKPASTLHSSVGKRDENIMYAYEYLVINSFKEISSNLTEENLVYSAHACVTDIIAVFSKFCNCRKQWRLACHSSFPCESTLGR